MFYTFFAFHLCFFATYPVFGHSIIKLCYYEATKEVISMIKRFMKSRWWNLTCAITALATVGYVIYMAYAFHILMVWFLLASAFITVYEFWKFATIKKNEVT
ncbi:hypothetical protein B0O40_0249 [Ruminococcaceae bacterium R-25]|nr:hypothetical protein B0O40_0249 [Ruminococcaceae bacterium R-25]SUQ10894.1 hypothetical protein SAMN06297423_0249 [Oscillospiraceae bacterium]